MAELKTRSGVNNDMVLVPKSTIFALEEKITKLTMENKILSEQASKDTLIPTIGNRRALAGLLESEKSKIEREDANGKKGMDMACIYFDLNEFKQINDTLGHDAGDALLKKFADILVSNARGYDQVFRVGGDEFTVILAGDDRAGANAYTGRVMADVAKVEGLKTASGISTFREAGGDMDLMIKMADGSMYDLKRAQRQ